MPPAETAPLLWPVLAIIFATVATCALVLGAGWKGLQWLRDRMREVVREEQQSDAARQARQEDMLSALRSVEGQRLLSDAVSGVAEPLTKVTAEHTGELALLKRKLTEVERKVGALHRIVTRIVEVLQRAGLTKGEETGT